MDGRECRQPVLPGARDQRTELRDVSSTRAGLEHHADGAARSLRPHGRTRPDLPDQRRLQLRRRRRLDDLEAASGLQPAADEGADSHRARRSRSARSSTIVRRRTIPIDAAPPLTSASMYRRPLPSANLKFLSAVMWDGRESKPGQAIRDGLISQVVDAVTRPRAGRASRARAGCSRSSISSSGCSRRRSSIGRRAVSPEASHAAVPDALAREPFCIGINDPLDMRPSMPGACAASSGGLNPFVFTLFRGWTDAEFAAAPGDRARRGDLQHAPVRHRQRAGPERTA